MRSLTSSRQPRATTRSCRPSRRRSRVLRPQSTTTRRSRVREEVPDGARDRAHAQRPALISATGAVAGETQLVADGVPGAPRPGEGRRAERARSARARTP